MPVSNLIKLLEESLQQAREAAGHLSVSFGRCKAFASAPQFTEEQLIELEAFTGRFARLSDLLIQKVFKTIDRLDRETPGTVRDRILQAEKKGLITNAETLLQIRDVRNTISHDYDMNSFRDIISFALVNTPVLTDILQRAMEYCQKFYS